MADNFNRAALTSPAVEQRKPGFGGLGALLMILVVIAAVVVAYKIIQSGAPIAAAAQQNRSMEKIQQQLNSIEGRLDRLERHRAVAPKSSAAESQRGKVPGKAAPQESSGSAALVSADAAPQAPDQPGQSGIPAEAKSDSFVASAALTDASSNDPGANRDAWQATANQLTDMVGVVGSQQAELSKTQAALGRLTAESQHFAVPFQLHRGSRPQRVGPVALELKNSDVHRQRYSVSVLLDDKPVEFKNRAVDELVDFVLPGESAPVRFVATKIGHDSISGYMEVPGHSTPR